MSQKPNPRRKGLSLLEIVLAMGLAAIAISMLAQLISVGNRAAEVCTTVMISRLSARSAKAPPGNKTSIVSALPPVTSITKMLTTLASPIARVS